MKILIVRRDNIGDLVCTTPMIASLREHYPAAQIYALVNDYNLDVLDKHPLLDGVFSYTKLKHRKVGVSALQVVFRKIRTYWALRHERFDYVIVAGSGYSKNAVRLAKAAKSKHVISFIPDDELFDPVIDIPVPFKREYIFRHEVECLTELLRPLGISKEPGPLELPVVTAPPELLQRFANNHRPVIALHISAREASRVWGVENFCKLISGLLQQNVELLLLWAPGPSDDPRHPGDDEKMLEIRQQFPDKVQLTFYPTTTVKQLMGAFSCADIVICSDGGGLHIAAGVGARVVGLFEHLEKKTRHWYPWQVPHRVITSGSTKDWAVGHIAVQDVVTAVDELLEQ